MERNFLDSPISYGVCCTRLSVGVFTAFLCESVLWPQIFCDAQELLLAVSKSGNGKNALSPADIRRRIDVSRHTPRRASLKVNPVEEGKEPEGEPKTKVTLVGNPESGTVHAFVSR